MTFRLLFPSQLALPATLTTIMARNTAVKRKLVQNKAHAQNETKIQAASDMLSNGTFKRILDAVHHFSVPYDTLRRRHLGLTEPQSEAHQKEQLLTTAKEETVCKWVRYMGMTGRPILKEALHVKVANISITLQERQMRTGE